MKYLLLLIIRLYQTFIPKRFRGKCLFKESCSNYVFRITKEKGLIVGLNALKYRYFNCRPNYNLMDNNGKIVLITINKNVIEEEFIDERILCQYKQDIFHTQKEVVL
jgi:putative component of membrane protein insertase Oxa1/YidC/SpoIIIJ protein YidD